MGFPFLTNDGGRSNSKRPKAKNDCTVRTLAIAIRLSYDDAYDILAAAGRKCHQGFDFSGWLEKGIPATTGRTATRQSHPAVKGKRRMNPVTFCKQYPRGTYICKSAGHVFVVRDGVVQDTHKPYDERCIYTSWKISERTS